MPQFELELPLFLDFLLLMGVFYGRCLGAQPLFHLLDQLLQLLFGHFILKRELFLLSLGESVGVVTGPYDGTMLAFLVYEARAVGVDPDVFLDVLLRFLRDAPLFVLGATRPGTFLLFALAIVEYLDFLAFGGEFLEQFIDALVLFPAEADVSLGRAAHHLDVDLGGVDAGAGLGEELLELVDFLFVLLEEGVLGVFVDARLVLDGFGAGSVPEGGKRLVVVEIGGGNGGDHHGLGVAAEGVLEHARQLGVAVGDVVGFAVHQGADHVSQGLEYVSEI